jgi:hypothetical protein
MSSLFFSPHVRLGDPAGNVEISDDDLGKVTAGRGRLGARGADGTKAF